jgi:hypothetical protein
MKQFGWEFTASYETSLKYFLLFNKLPQGYLFRGHEKLQMHVLVALNNEGEKKNKRKESEEALHYRRLVVCVLY